MALHLKCRPPYEACTDVAQGAIVHLLKVAPKRHRFLNGEMREGCKEHFLWVSQVEGASSQVRDERANWTMRNGEMVLHTGDVYAQGQSEFRPPMGEGHNNRCATAVMP